MSTRNSSGPSQKSSSGSAQSPNERCAITRFTSFGGSNIKRLSAGDFTIDSDTRIAIKYSDCLICLFHTDNHESHQMMDIWKSVAVQTAGPVFAACNVLLENEVAQAFAAVASNGNHPFHSFGLHQWPVIITYRGGYPAAVYNGSRATQPIIDWALTLACKAGYFEGIQIYGSMRADDAIAMEGGNIYKNDRRSSIKYTESNPIRHSGKLPVVKEGSEAEKVTTEERRQKEAEEAGIPLTQQELQQGIYQSPEAKSPDEILQDIDMESQNPRAQSPQPSTVPQGTGEASESQEVPTASAPK